MATIRDQGRAFYEPLRLTAAENERNVTTAGFAADATPPSATAGDSISGFKNLLLSFAINTAPTDFTWVLWLYDGVKWVDFIISVDLVAATPSTYDPTKLFAQHFYHAGEHV